MHKLLYFLLAVVAAFILFPDSPAGSQESSVHEITVIRNTFKLNPQDLTIKGGDTIRWTNTDERKHNIASIPGSGPTDELEIFSVMEPGAVYTHMFKTPGEYPYFCFIHPQMTGKITVTK